MVTSDSSYKFVRHQVADENSLQMEQFMIDVCEEETGNMGFEVLAYTARSFNDVSFATIFFDVWKMLGGYVIMFIYTVLMLGRLTKTEVRLYLSGAGIFSCILGLGASFGIMFILGMEYNQTHHILPFIAIGTAKSVERGVLLTILYLL